VIDVPTGVGVVGRVVGVVPPSPHAASKSTAVNRMHRMLSICAPLLYPRQRGDPCPPSDTRVRGGQHQRWVPGLTERTKRIQMTGKIRLDYVQLLLGSVQLFRAGLPCMP
jgi:hypothetical protein